MGFKNNNGLKPEGDNAIDKWIKKLNIPDVVVPKGTVCGYCNDTGWDSYPNHDTTPRPCPECQP